MSLCSICLSNYIDPRILPCGHSFCLLCLQKLDKLRCPLCQLQFVCIQDLVPNYALFTTPRARHDCKTCRYSKELWCEDCSLLICQVAQEDNWHHGHQVLDLQEARQRMMEKLSKQAEEVARSTLAAQSASTALPANDYPAKTAENLATWQAKSEKLIAEHQRTESATLLTHIANLQEKGQAIAGLLAVGDKASLSAMAALLGEPLPMLCLQKGREELQHSLISLNKEFLTIFSEWTDKQQTLAIPEEVPERRSRRSYTTLNATRALLRDKPRLRNALDAGLSPDHCVRGQSLLMLAVEGANYGSFKLLLHRGANPNMTTADVRFPVLHSILHYMRVYSEPIKYIALLHEHGADSPSAETIDERGWLIEAREMRNRKLLEYLINLGANPDVTEKSPSCRSARDHAHT